MQKARCFSCLAALVLGSALWADTGVVHFTDGSSVTGEINDSDPKQVTVTLHGVQETFPRETVSSIEHPGTIDEQFTLRLTRLALRDVKGRIDLAVWAVEQNRYDLARTAATDAIRIDPENQDAIDLLNAVTREAQLMSGRGPQTRPAAGTSDASANAVAGNGAENGGTIGVIAADARYVNADQINEIRQQEMKPGEPVRVVFKNDVRKRYLAGQITDSAAFYSLSPAAQAMEIFTKGDPAFAKDVRIVSDPAALVEFRTGGEHIQPIVLGGCAVAGCHNAPVSAGGFGLFTDDDSPKAAYTNFFRLVTYRSEGKALAKTAAGGPFGGKGTVSAPLAASTGRPANASGAVIHSMIDRLYPDQSLLAQYGLPQRLAQTPHPAAANFHPIFGGKNDPHYQSLLRWIGYDLRPDGGKYGDIELAPMKAASALVMPTTEPGK